MKFDPHANLAYGTVLTPPSPADSGVSVTLQPGQGAAFPDPAVLGAYNATFAPNGAVPTNANSEIVRVTARAGDVFTITRAQEGTSARGVQVGDRFALTITAKSLTDVEAALNGGSHSVLYAEAYGMVSDFNGTTGTDNTAALTAAIAALPAEGGTVILPRGHYYFAGTIDFHALSRESGVRIVGQYGSGVITSTSIFDAPTNDACVLWFAQNVGNCFSFLGDQSGGGGIRHRGPQFENFVIREVGDGGTNTLIYIRLANHWGLREMALRGGLKGLEIDSDNSTFGGAIAGGDASYGFVGHCMFTLCTTGINVPHSGGFTMIGGHVSKGTTGINIRGGYQQMIFGVRFDANTNSIVTTGNTIKVIGCEFEAVTGICVTLDGNADSAAGTMHQVALCNFNPKAGVGATAISVSSACTDAQLIGNTFTAGTFAWLADLGVRTRIVDAGGFKPAITSFAPTTSATLLDKRVDVARFDLTNASGGGLTCKLPTVSGAYMAGKEISVKKTDASAHVLTVQGNASETINGAANFTLTGQYAEKKLRCDGTNWEIVSTNGIA